MATTLATAQRGIGNCLCSNSPTSSISRSLSKTGEAVLLKDRGAWSYGVRRQIQDSRNSGRFGDGRHRRLQATAAADSGEESVEALEAKLGLGRRKRSGGGPGAPSPEKPIPVRKDAGPIEPPKSFDVLAFLRDANEGVLFWLNKLSYGAIFVLIGAWILFRFVGPSLGFYELENPLLPPDQVFKGP